MKFAFQMSKINFIEEGGWFMKKSGRKTFWGVIFSAMFLILMAATNAQAADISVGNVSGAAGDTITVPVLISNAPNDVKACGMEVVFNNNSLTYSGFFVAGTLFESWSGMTGFAGANLIGDNTVRIGGADVNGFTAGTTDTLINLTFTVNDPCNESSFTFLNLADDIKTWAADMGTFSCKCTSSATESCSTGQSGVCAEGTKTCDGNGDWGVCEPNVTASAETCDNLDNNCDGSVDEDLTRSCGSDEGACHAGTQTCSAGSWGATTV